MADVVDSFGVRLWNGVYYCKVKFPDGDSQEIKSKEDLTYSHDTLWIDADDYIFKPCSKAKLWKRVSNCIERLELKRSIASLGLDIDVSDEVVLKKLRIILNTIQSPVFQMKEILKQIKWDSLLDTNYDVAIKLRDLDEIVTSLSSTVVELLGEVSEVNGDFSIEENMTDWKEDVMSPVLGNLPN